MNKDFRFTGMRTMVLGLSVSVLMLGCSSEGGEDAAPTDAPTGEQAAAPATGGVTGKISFDGVAPERTVIEAEGDAKCAQMHAGSPILSDSAIVSADGALANVFVYVTNPPEGDFPPSETPVKLDQVGCMYTPHVLGVQVGQKMMIHNSDETTHNVRAVARKNKPMNAGQPVGSKPRSKTFKKEELKIRFKCDFHPWMTAYVFAMDTPFFGVSDESGAFNIQGLPAGEYEVTAWHEEFGEQDGTVTVDAEGNGSVDFTFSG